jgi:hypothetical protein
LLKRLVREPLLHFSAMALLVFAVYYALGPGEERPTGQITVTAAKIQQMTAVFARTWQRPPTAAEAKGLIDDYVREEIYVREALALGLDADDTIIRRRLRQKMEFMTASATDSVAPTDAELETYLAAHPEKFQVEPMLAFEQVFLDSARHGDKLKDTVTSTLQILTSAAAGEATAVGDPSLLPAELPLSPKQAVVQIFGPDFAAAVEAATLGQWSGPFKSSFGIHLVKLAAREPGRVPSLNEARDAVLREWSNDKRLEAERQQLEALLKRYGVKIEYPSGTAGQP